MRRRGFTMMELLLVVAITGVLLLGVGVIIEVPRRVAESQQTDAPVSSALVSIDQLEKDVRFAADVVVPDPKRLQVFPKGAPMIEYAWDGVIGGVLTRTDARGTVTLLKNVRTLAFDIESKTLRGETEDHDVTETAVEAASWSVFDLKPGYVFGLLGALVVAVTSSTKAVDSGQSLAYYFEPAGLGGDDALPTQITVRLRRRGTASLDVVLYSADPVTKAPNLARPLAKSSLRSAALPGSMTDFSIPLTATGRVSSGGAYLAVLSLGSGGTSACEVEHHLPSNQRGVDASTTTFLRNTGGRWELLPGLLTFDASQAPFSFQATVADVDDSTGGATTVTVPVNVTLRMALVSEAGTKQVQTSFSVHNNLCRLHQR